MNPKLQKLITAIVSHVKGQDGGFVTKTKLLKLLYLFDVEFYRKHRQTFTGFNWKYYHLGPWTNEYDSLLSELVSSEALTRQVRSHSDYDAEFYDTPSAVSINEALSAFSDENILRAILNTWGGKTTGEILDYVYFQTEPIVQGRRNELLDFSHISEQSPLLYTRSSSGATPKDIAALRKRIEEKKNSLTLDKASSISFTPPRYDEDYLQAIEVMDRETSDVY